ncbi:MAG: VOC family protein [Spirochaetaceae bacterium]
MVTYVCDHIHLKAKDVDKTVQWYVDTLGAKVTFEGHFKGSKVLYFDINGFTFICFGRLEGEEGENAPIEPTLRTRFGNDHFGFQVENMDEAVAELKRKGVTFIEEPWSPRDGLKIAYIEGPDKAAIELTQRDS